MPSDDLLTTHESVPYSTFFKVWYHLQKDVPEDEKKALFTRIGREIGKEVNLEGVETVEAFLERVQAFLEKEWGITSSATLDIVEKDGEVVQVRCHMDACKMCPPNTHYKQHDGGKPTCMFPQVMMGALGKVKSKLGLRNIAFESVSKPGPVGECIMTWNVK